MLIVVVEMYRLVVWMWVLRHLLFVGKKVLRENGRISRHVIHLDGWALTRGALGGSLLGYKRGMGPIVDMYEARRNSLTHVLARLQANSDRSANSEIPTDCVLRLRTS